MGYVVDGAELRHQLALRGLSARDLAETSGLSEATISHALSGRPVSVHTIRAVVTTLDRVKPFAGVDALLGFNERPGHEATGYEPS